MLVKSRLEIYIFVLVNDYSRYTWTIFSAAKDDAFEVFCSLMRKIQRKYGKQLKAIRSNHGTEFENSKFAQYCDYHGVDHNFSAPRTPQQNGVVERKNRTLQEMTRTMMITSKIANQFWAEAINTACYTINRCMTRPLLEKTPYELLKGRKPNISHLRVFGCKCFIHKNGKNLLGKFDARSDNGIFL